MHLSSIKSGLHLVLGLLIMPSIAFAEAQREFVPEEPSAGSYGFKIPRTAVVPHDVPLPPAEDGFFEGINSDESGTTPPDPTAAALATTVVSAVNTAVQWYTKSGTRLANIPLTQFFQSLNPGPFLFDPKVIYDQYSGRCLVVAMDRDNLSLTSRILVAVTSGGDPTLPWYFLSIDSTFNFGGDLAWADFPGLAIGEDAIYITANIFSFNQDPGPPLYYGSRLWIIDKHPLYEGSPPDPGDVAVHDALGAAGAPFATAQPAHMFGSRQGNVGTFLVVGPTGGGGPSNANLWVVLVRNPLPPAGATFESRIVGV